MANTARRDDAVMYRSALAYAQAGFYVFPCYQLDAAGDCTCPKKHPSRDPQTGECHNAGKHPRTFNGVKDATRDLDEIRRMWSGEALHANIGLACGPSGLVVIDVDPRNGGDETLGALLARHGPFPETPIQLTGGGGQHYVFRRPNMPVVRGPKDGVGRGVDIKADGGYVIAAPSRHKSGKVYAWDSSARLLPPEAVAPADVPPWLLSMLEAKERARLAPSSGAVEDSYLGRCFKLEGWLGRALPNGKAAARCPWEDEHTGGTRFDGSTVLYPANPGHRFGHFDCAHNHCRGRRGDDVLAKIPTATKDLAKAELGLSADYDNPRARGTARATASSAAPAGRPTGRVRLEPIETPPPPPEEPPPSPPGGGGGGDDDDASEPWREELRYGRGGKLLPIPGNAIALVGNLPEWQGTLEYDAFADRVRWIAPPPELASAIAPRPGEDLQDRHTDYVQHWLSCEWGLHVSTTAVHAALVLAAHRNTVHPLQTYLTGLKWDKKSRLSNWLHYYLGAEDAAETNAMGLWWMISAVARGMRPGCQADHVLILEGGQGAGKTRAVRTLAGEWYLGNVGDLRSKDAALNLQGHWLVEIGELDAFRGLAMTRIKDWVTQTVDVYRPPYGRIPTRRPRSCVFVATTNEKEYLGDATGARRFWPVPVGSSIDTEALAQDRDQLWAEAKYLFDIGTAWWPPRDDDELRNLIAAAQEDRYEPDAWEGLIAAFVADVGRMNDGVTMAEVLEGALGLKNPGDWRRDDQMRAARALVRLGWHKPPSGKRRGGSRVWHPGAPPAGVMP